MPNRTAIITGASSGIGEATALALAERGWNVALAARREDRLINLATRINSASGGRAIAISCDVTKKGDPEKLVKKTLDELDSVDALVNNAGIMHLAPIQKLRVGEWDQMIDLNITGAVHAAAAVLPHMLRKKRGHIVNVSSIAGKRVIPAGVVYCATKHFLHAFSEGLRMELAGENIRVTTIAPGAVATELFDNIGDRETAESFGERLKDMTPLQSEDIARAVAYALDEPDYVGINEIVVRPTAQDM